MKPEHALELPPIPQERLDAYARQLVRSVVEEELARLLELRAANDCGSLEVKQKSGPAGAINTDGAKEQGA